MPEESEIDPMEEELTLSQISQEYKIKRGTLNNWVSDKKITSRLEYTEIGTPYRVVKRGEIERVLQNRSNMGRPLERS